jgi:hypothetical protein
MMYISVATAVIILIFIASKLKTVTDAINMFQKYVDTKGEYLACRAASRVWEFLGRGGMPKGDFPREYDTSLVGENLGYVRRGGAHGLSGYDWIWLLDFADRSLRRITEGNKSCGPLILKMT